jgi:hypothetical protein
VPRLASPSPFPSLLLPVWQTLPFQTGSCDQYTHSDTALLNDVGAHCLDFMPKMPVLWWELLKYFQNIIRPATADRRATAQIGAFRLRIPLLSGHRTVAMPEAVACMQVAGRNVRIVRGQREPAELLVSCLTSAREDQDLPRSYASTRTHQHGRLKLAKCD